MIVIEKMKEEHVASVAQLEQECFSAPWSEASIRSELTNPLSLWLVAICEGSLVGYVGSQTVQGEADMMNIAVKDSFRRKGIGCELVSALIRALKAENAYSLTLEVRASNEPAKTLYSKLGFTQVGRRPNYYTAPREDALILRKEWPI